MIDKSADTMKLISDGRQDPVLNLNNGRFKDQYTVLRNGVTLASK